MSRIRVLVVEDSSTVRNHLVEVLGADSDFEVIAEAGDGQRAIELCLSLRPDVVSMDMMMPVMSGLAATEYIMAYGATPILIVSASTNRGELFRTYEALAAGAVDVLEKPRGDGSDDAWGRKYRAALRLVSRIRVITHPRARLSAAGRKHVERSTTARPAQGSIPYRAVAIGASTGGPGAIVRLLGSVPVPCPVPVLLVLHISEPFGGAFAEWLDGQTGHHAMLARSGAMVADYTGMVLMAPPGRHMLVENGRIRLTGEAERNSCRPSIDVLFESLAEEYGAACAACLLTGMGRDGASGLLRIRQAGGLTMAQDEASSIVYGMPREAARLNAAMHVLGPQEIGTALAKALHAGPKRRGEP